MFDGCKKQIIPDWYKKRLTESTLNFNPADYNDDSVVSNNEVSNTLYKYHPQNIFELWEILAEKLEQNIKYPNLSDIDISNLDSLKSLFSSLKNDWLWSHYGIDTSEIIKLDLSAWDTSNIKDMSGMFYNCVSLEEVNISGWDFSNIQETDYMFYKCMSLDKINGNINISKIPNKENMFFGCKAHIIPKEYIPLMSDYEKAWMIK
jgi:surface protein